MSAQPASKDEGDERARAFEQAYRASHPNGAYPLVELKPKQEK